MTTNPPKKKDTRRRKNLNIENELMDWIGKKPNANAYINDLIRADMEHQKLKREVERELILQSLIAQQS